MSEIITIPASIRKADEKTGDWTPVKVIYAGLMAFNLLSFLWLLINGTSIEDVPLLIWFTRLCVVPVAIYQGRLWKKKEFLILAAYTVLFFLRCFLSAPDSVFTAELSENFLAALWLFAGCYGLGRTLSPGQMNRFLLICCSLWTFVMMILCCMGIYVCWTGRILTPFNGAEIQIYLDARLNLFYLATTSGSIIGVSFFICIISALSIKNRFLKTFFFLAMIPIILAIALTDSRTAYISTSAGIGVIVFSSVYHYMQVKKTIRIRQSENWKAWIISIMSMVIVFGIIIWTIMQITPLFNTLKTRGFIPAAYAEDTQPSSVIASRKFSGHLLSGRAELWGTIFNYIQQKPLILLIGESKIAPLSGFNTYYAHCHNIYIQVLLESGVPGLILISSFIAIVLGRSLRVIRQKEYPCWIRLLPAIPVVLFVEDIADCFTWLRASQCPMGAILLIAAGILSAYGEKKKITMDE